MNAFAKGHVVVLGPDEGSPPRAACHATHEKAGGSNPHRGEARLARHQGAGAERAYPPPCA